MANTIPDIQLPSWPREQMQPVLRLEYDRAYPEGSPLRVESYPMLPSRPLYGADPWPPMRDALLDTLDFLGAVAHDLSVRGLHCLEVSVQPGLAVPRDGAGGSDHGGPGPAAGLR